MKSTAPERVPGILHLSHIFDAFLLDAHGVFWGGNDYGLLPGSKEAMETLVSSGKIVGILSNSTQLASEETDKFRRAGLLRGRHCHFLITSGETARSILLQEQLPFETKSRRFLDFVQRVLWEELLPSQLNVAAVGNRTPQLHVHVIARYENDPARPLTVWDHKVRAPYDEEGKNMRVQKPRRLLGGYTPQAIPSPDFP